MILLKPLPSFRRSTRVFDSASGDEITQLKGFSAEMPKGNAEGMPKGENAEGGHSYLPLKAWDGLAQIRRGVPLRPSPPSAFLPRGEPKEG
jgi:hypothetical protein